jgi:hypothetical protein
VSAEEITELLRDLDVTATGEEGDAVYAVIDELERSLKDVCPDFKILDFETGNERIENGWVTDYYILCNDREIRVSVVFKEERKFYASFKDAEVTKEHWSLE